MSFECDKCGLCCRNLNRSPLYKELDDGTGKCRFLKGSLCGIYEERPLLCRIEESYDAFFKEIMSKEEYYRLNTEVCNQLKEENKLCRYH